MAVGKPNPHYLFFASIEIPTTGLALGCARAATNKAEQPSQGAKGPDSAPTEASDELSLNELFGPRCTAPTGRLAELAKGPMPRVSEEQRERYLLDCANAGRLTPELCDEARPALLARGRALLQRLEATRPATGVGWRWQEPYVGTRIEAEVLWDLLGLIGRNDEATALLQRAEALPDPLMKLWSGVSLLRFGQELTAGSSLAIAADPETRNPFFDKLGELHRLELFPAAERTQAKFAESEMVRWLVYPTELARAPDHIELMKTMDADLGPDDSAATYYLFRFKTDPPDQFAKDGWMAGIAGPFLRKDAPTTDARGETFSTFAAWDSASPEQHLQQVQKLIDEVAARRAAGSP
ncbi:MAG TPA: hypothetical protein VHB79_30420 [Polyangiaceae bacterium]|nr:hypothetical protein [Polyangiaceae bacterium]